MKSRFVAAVAALGSVLSVLAGSAQAAPVSFQVLYERVPAPPATSVEAARSVTLANRITGAAWVQLRQQIEAERKAATTMMLEAAEPAQASVTGVSGIDYARMQSDPAYAQRMQAQMQKEAARIQSLPPAQQMAEAMKMQQRFQQQAVQGVQKMAQDPPAVATAVETFHARVATQAADMAAQSALQARADAIKRKVEEQANAITREAGKRFRCSDGEGGCATPGDEAHDRALARETWGKCRLLYDGGLRELQAVFADARRARAAVVSKGQAQLAAAEYGRAAQSATNRQVLGQYHNMMLNEVEALLNLSEDAVAWAGARLHQPEFLGYAVQ